MEFLLFYFLIIIQVTGVYFLVNLGVANQIFINAFIDVVLEALMEGEDVLLTGLGKFVLAERKERTGRDWTTGEQIVIPARKVPAFEFSKGTKDKIKEAVNKE